MPSNNTSARILVRLIHRAYEAREGIFSSVTDLLEAQVPPNVDYGSSEHARFYFYLIFNDHGTKSTRLYEKFKKLYSEASYLFDPVEVIKRFENREDYLRETFLSNLGLRYPKQATISWVTNSRILIDKYEGEPINLFLSAQSAPELFKKIKYMRGYGPKTSGLLLRVIWGAGFNRHLVDIHNVPLPVDIHDSRIAFICGLYRPNGIDDIYKIYGNPSHIQKIEKIWRNAAHQESVSWEGIDRALWLLGSRGCANKRCRECPINNFCEIGREVLNGQKSLPFHETIQH